MAIKTQVPIVTKMVITTKKLSKTEVMRRALDASYDHVRKMHNKDLGDENTLVFILPLSPVSLNSRLHWRTADVMKKRYKERFESLMRGYRDLPDVPSTPWEKASIEATFYTRATNDIDNLIGRAKISLDCIVKAGYIADDSPEHLTWAAMPQQVVNGKSPAYLVIRLKREYGEWTEIEVKP